MTIYEWSREVTDEDGDIIDVDFADRIGDLGPDGDLVLVRRTGDEINGENSRFYAYVKEGKLPEFFDDSDHKVPQKYHKQLANEKNH